MKIPDHVIDHLDRYLDHATESLLDRTDLNGYVSTVIHAAETFHGLDANDATANPRPDFLATLERQLMSSRSNAGAPVDTTRSIPFAGRRPNRQSRPESRYLAAPARWFATAGLLFVVAGLAFLSFRGDGAPSGNGLVAVATPEFMKSLPYTTLDLAECTTTARPEGTVKALIGQPPTNAPFLPKQGEQIPAEFPTVIASPFAGLGGVLDPLPLLEGLPEVDEATASGIDGAIVNLSACRAYTNSPDPMQPGSNSADVDGRYYAVFSDDYFRLSAFIAQDLNGNELIVAGGRFSFGPVPWVAEDLRMLQDGRVLALVSPMQPTGSIVWSLLIVLSNAGDRWRIDEIVQVDPEYYSDLKGPGAPQSLEIVLRDDEEATIESMTTFQSRPITVTIANIGTRPHEFQIASLGLVLTIEPGHSISFELTPPPGLYVMESYVPSGLHPEQTVPRLEQVLRIVEAGTPIPLG